LYFTIQHLIEGYTSKGDTLYPQKLALTSLTSGGRSVGIVRSRTQATEFSFFYTSKVIHIFQSIPLVVYVTKQNLIGPISLFERTARQKV
jgi:hypothetical protein